ncbi:MAG TPA: AAA family ATPase [Verrucomicrobiae bacterium]|jgi:aminoglycoside phosphotransferase family enzyme/predicted kinase|nr:AAA family ATPase [Verrucomicrobiae bacterium]
MEPESLMLPSPRADQESLVQAMLDPAFYPRRPSTVNYRETHISHLFFAGDLVYKVKKDVRYSFVDYSNLERRLFFLQEELRLNRRLAPSVYLGILPISHDDYGWQLGSDAQLAEYALVMRRLPERRMLDHLLDTGQATPSMMDAVAETLAPFHAAAPNGRKVRPFGDPARIRSVWTENLSDLDPFIGRTVDAGTLAAIRAFGDSFLAEHSELMQRRALAGYTREVHGDLHCEHICFAPEGIQIYDCVEFSRRFRFIDVASEVAFLSMDLQARGAREHAQRFINRYVELTNDADLAKLLPFYECYRALVRAKVFTLIFRDRAEAASRYFDQAYSYTWQALKPFVVMIAGLTGSGKSTLARALARRLGATVINSDVTRKRLAGASDRHDQLKYGEGLYSPAMTARAYRKMMEEADNCLAAGRSVILDATFHKAAQRDPSLEIAERRGASIALIECHARDDLIRERLAARAEARRDPSDGNWQIYLKQKELFEPFTLNPNRLRLDTELSLAQLTNKSEEFLRAALAKPANKTAYPIRIAASNLLSETR